MSTRSQDIQKKINSLVGNIKALRSYQKTTSGQESNKIESEISALRAEIAEEKKELDQINSQAQGRGVLLGATYKNKQDFIRRNHDAINFATGDGIYTEKHLKDTDGLLANAASFYHDHNKQYPLDDKTLFQTAGHADSITGKVERALHPDEAKNIDQLVKSQHTEVVRAAVSQCVGKECTLHEAAQITKDQPKILDKAMENIHACPSGKHFEYHEYLEQSSEANRDEFSKIKAELKAMSIKDKHAENVIKDIREHGLNEQNIAEVKKTLNLTGEDATKYQQLADNYQQWRDQKYSADGTVKDASNTDAKSGLKPAELTPALQKSAEASQFARV